MPNDRYFTFPKAFEQVWNSGNILKRWNVFFHDPIDDVDIVPDKGVATSAKTIIILIRVN